MTVYSTIHLKHLGCLIIGKLYIQERNVHEISSTTCLSFCQPVFQTKNLRQLSNLFRTYSYLIRKDRQPNTENPLKLNLSGVIVKHLPYRGK